MTKYKQILVIIKAILDTLAEINKSLQCKQDIGTTPSKDLKACHYIKKKTPTQVLSCEYCETFKNTFFHRTVLVGASDKIIVSALKISIQKYAPETIT